MSIQGLSPEILLQRAAKELTEKKPVHPLMLTTGGQTAIVQGITKRELFAAMAMQGILSRTDCDDGSFNAAFNANVSVGNADALLKELEKKNDEEKTL